MGSQHVYKDGQSRWQYEAVSLQCKSTQECTEVQCFQCKTGADAVHTSISEGLATHMIQGGLGCRHYILIYTLIYVAVHVYRLAPLMFTYIYLMPLDHSDFFMLLCEITILMSQSPKMS